MTDRRGRSSPLLAIAALLALALTAVSGTAASSPRWLGDVPGLGAAAPDPTPPGVPITLSGCTITNPFFKAGWNNARKVVPSRYELGTNAFFGPGVATVMAGVLACDGVGIDGRMPDRRVRPMVLSLIAVQVTTDPATGDPADRAWNAYERSTLNVLPSSSWYLIGAQTNNVALARRLRRAGLPVAHAPGVAYKKDYGGANKSDWVKTRAYRLATTTTFADPFIHNHDWQFWHDAAPERTVGLFLHLHAMSDSSCGYHFSELVHATMPSCGATLTALHQSTATLLAALLGRPSSRKTYETPFAFNHPPSHARGYITLPQRSVSSNKGAPAR